VLDEAVGFCLRIPQLPQFHSNITERDYSPPPRNGAEVAVDEIVIIDEVHEVGLEQRRGYLLERLRQATVVLELGVERFVRLH